MRFLFVCGGTAGHINPALALAEKLKELVGTCEIEFAGAGREMEKRLIPKEGYKLTNITITGFSRKISPDGIANNIKTLKNLIIANGEAKRLIERFEPDVVIGTGGYVCYPVLKQAIKMNIPTVLHESNAVPGLTTKMLSGSVDDMLVAFPAAKENYKKKSNIKVTGTPVHGQFSKITKSEAKKIIGVPDKPLVVSFWGSLGASNMNNAIVDFIEENSKKGSFYHIHASGGGEDGRDRLIKNIDERGIDCKSCTDVRAYIDNMGIVMRAADIVMCRAGASTVAELTMIGTPSILVPSPNVTNNHQEANARAVMQAGGAEMVLERDMSGKGLYELTEKLLEDKEKLKEMGENAKSLGVADSTEMIANIILSHIK